MVVTFHEKYFIHPWHSNVQQSPTRAISSGSLPAHSLVGLGGPGGLVLGPADGEVDQRGPRLRLEPHAALVLHDGAVGERVVLAQQLGRGPEALKMKF